MTTMKECFMSEKCEEIVEIGKNFCLLQKDIEYLRRDQEVILARFGKHVEDAERSGGRHERLKDVEDRVKVLEDIRRNDLIVQRWFMVGSGIIGGSIVSGSPEIIRAVLRLLGVH